MSYASDVKDELLEQPIKWSCCRKQCAAGMLLGAFEDEKGRLTIRFSTRETAEACRDILIKALRGNAEVTERRYGKNSFWDLALDSEEAKRIYASGQIPQPVCQNCRPNYLKGAFLACGTVNRPEQSSHLEFRVSEKTGPVLERALEDVGMPISRVKRDGHIGLYYKSNPKIQDFLGLIGASRAEFEHINAKIVRGLIREDHQTTNFEFANIQKSVIAAQNSLQAAEKIRAAGLLDTLGTELRMTAELRLANPEATLRELAALHCPVLSVSGLSHRIKSLREIADKL